MKVNILAIGAHPDDVELSCAGTIIKHIKLGQTVAIVDLTEGELGTRGTVESRRAEAKAASEIMGVAARENLGMADGFFKNDHEHQLRLIAAIRHYQPDIVLANAVSDRHPDHGRAAQLISDSCFLAGLKKIETSRDGVAQEVWRPKKVLHYIQDRMLTPSLVVDISDTFEQKIESIKAYGSQFFDPNSNEPVTYIATPEFMDSIRVKARMYGRMIGAAYGEPYQMVTPVGLQSFTDLVLGEIV